jgi:predicted nucleic acid-binding Zn ribbon protein
MKSHVVEAHKMQGYKYQCDVCTKRFEVKSAIRKHYRHEDTEHMRLDKY